MKKLMWMVVLFGVVTMYACKKDDPDDPAPAVQSEYLQLTPGTYWVYEVYKIDSLGIAVLTNQSDSVVVTRDTLIGNKAYYVMEGRTGFAGYDWKILGCYRDSAQCLVDDKGAILFSQTNFTDTIHSWLDFGTSFPDTFIYSFTRMEDPGQAISVPAGAFQALNAKSKMKIYYYNTPSGTETRQFTLNRFFGHGVGEILSSYAFVNEYYQTGAWYERRLVRYHVAK